MVIKFYCKKYTVAALNMTTSRRREEENDTMEVVVDGDDTSTYGYTQYTEADIHAAMNRTESRSPTPARNQDGNSDANRLNWNIKSIACSLSLDHLCFLYLVRNK